MTRDYVATQVKITSNIPIKGLLLNPKSYLSYSKSKIGFECRYIHTLSKSFTRLASKEELFSYSCQSSWISSAADNKESIMATVMPKMNIHTV